MILRWSLIRMNLLRSGVHSSSKPGLNLRDSHCGKSLLMRCAVDPRALQFD